jgi:hypothetical protein
MDENIQAPRNHLVLIIFGAIIAVIGIASFMY